METVHDLNGNLNGNPNVKENKKTTMLKPDIKNQSSTPSSSSPPGVRPDSSQAPSPTSTPAVVVSPADRRWQAIGKSVIGASHLHSGLPNQDAIAASELNSAVSTLVMAVADGHGSERCFRSDRGSRFAVEIAIEVVGRLVTSASTTDALHRTDSHQTVNSPTTTTNRQKDGPTEASVERLRVQIQQSLPLLVTNEWRKRVEEDIKLFPFSEAERAKAGNPPSTEDRDPRIASPLLAYGSTLLIAAVTPTFLLFAQIGDGEILAVGPTGTVRNPVEADARLMGNRTTSLCQESAPQDFRISLFPLLSSAPALILLSSDGLPNCFKSDSEFQNVATVLFERIKTEGSPSVSRSLPEWLATATQDGSGDDITVGLLIRCDIDADPPKSFTESQKSAKSLSSLSTANLILSDEPDISVPRSSSENAPRLLDQPQNPILKLDNSMDKLPRQRTSSSRLSARLRRITGLLVLLNLLTLLSLFATLVLIYLNRPAGKAPPANQHGKNNPISPASNKGSTNGQGSQLPEMYGPPEPTK